MEYQEKLIQVFTLVNGMKHFTYTENFQMKLVLIKTTLRLAFSRDSYILGHRFLLKNAIIKALKLTRKNNFKW